MFWICGQDRNGRLKNSACRIPARERKTMEKITIFIDRETMSEEELKKERLEKSNEGKDKRV